jgi:hypothetical protein
MVEGQGGLLMLADEPYYEQVPHTGFDISSYLLMVGVIGALASLIFWIVYPVSFALRIYLLYDLIYPIIVMVRIPLGIGFVGYLSKHRSNLAYPAMLIFLIPVTLEPLYMFIAYEFRVGVGVVSLFVVGIMLLTVHRKTGNTILLYIFVAIMVADSFAPYIITRFLQTSEFLVYYTPYFIFDSAFFLFAALLFIMELRESTNRMTMSIIFCNVWERPASENDNHCD